MKNIVVSWKSSNKKTTIDSNVESKYITASKEANEAVWICKFWTWSGYLHDRTNIRYCDNNRAIASAMEPQSHQRSKHILKRCRLIKVIISTKWCESIKSAIDDNVECPLTKVLSQSKFEHHLESMSIRYLGDWLWVKWEIVWDKP